MISEHIAHSSSSDMSVGLMTIFVAILDVAPLFVLVMLPSMEKPGDTAVLSCRSSMKEVYDSPFTILGEVCSKVLREVFLLFTGSAEDLRARPLPLDGAREGTGAISDVLWLVLLVLAPLIEDPLKALVLVEAAEGPAVDPDPPFRALLVVTTVTSGSVADLTALTLVLARIVVARAVEATLGADDSDSDSEVVAMDGSGTTRRLLRVRSL